MRKRMFLVLLAQLMVMGMSAQVSFGKAEKVQR